MDYLEINRQLWNNKTPVHYKSDFYDNDNFIKGQSSLKEIELALLEEDLSGKSVLHLQCHFGQDSISLARMGAKVTGVDLSDAAIKQARDLAKVTGQSNNCRFVECDVYSAPEHIEEQFDIVFTTYGTIGWLPDTAKWAEVVSGFLKSGGRLVFVEFHPVIWMMDEEFTDVKYCYFNSEPIVETTEGTYTDKDAALADNSISWNHDLGEVFTALLNHGLRIESFQEYDYSPYNCLPKLKESEPGRWRIAHWEGKVPMVYSLTAVKD